MISKYWNIIFCLSLVVLLLPISASINIQKPGNDELSELEPQLASAKETTQDIGSRVIDPDSMERGTRAIIPHVNTGSNDPNSGATSFSTSGDQLTGTVGYGRIDWFFSTAFKTAPSSKQVYNVSITSNSMPFSWNDWVIVRFYVFWDFNYNNHIDEKEMVMLHQESYSGSGSTWNKCYGVTSHLSDYYISIEGRPNNQQSTLSYTLSVTWFEQDPDQDDINWDITNARQITKDTSLPIQTINMDTQAFDWYVLEAPTAGNSFGVNVSVRLKFNYIPPVYSDGLGTSFVLELMVVILHERQDAPSGNKIFGGLGNASKHKIIANTFHTDLPAGINYYSVQTWVNNNNKISRSYIGVFAMTYGIYTVDNSIVYHDKDISDDLEDPPINGKLLYSFIKVNIEPVIPPSVNDVKVFSLRTNTIEGKTYDKFRYQLAYRSYPNFEPIIMRVHIYSTTDPNFQTLVRILNPVDSDNTNYRTSPEYTFDIDGNELREGTFKFQIECWDKHTYASGSKVEKKIYNGPIIMNNIPPQVRQTAKSAIEMEEDDKTLLVKLHDTFIDVDEDEMTFYLINDDGEYTNFVETDNLIVDIPIQDNSKLRLTPKANQYGNSIISLAASDFPEEPNATHRLEIIIAPVNDPPRIIKSGFRSLFLFSEIQFYEDTNFSDLNLNEVFHDPIENDELSFSVSGNENVIVDIAENGTVGFYAKENWFGTEVLQFTATDPPGGFVSDELKVVVYPVNDAPILKSIPTVICYEESWTNLTFEASDPADDDKLVYSSNIALALNLKPEDYTFNNDNGELHLYPPNRVATGRDYTVTVWVYDIPPFVHGLKSITVSKEFTFVIRNKWDPPIPRIIEPNNGDIFLHTESIQLRGFCKDDDLKIPELNEKITYEWYSDIDGKIGDKDVVRNVMLSPGADGQQHQITLKVSDGKYQASTKISLYITKQNLATDSDGDGMPNYWEDRYHFNRDDPSDADGDPDKDNFTNLEEFWGMDFDPETPDDFTDPWDDKSHPIGAPPPKTSEEDDLFWPIVLLLMVVLIISVLIMITSSVFSRKIRDAREYSEKRHELEERIKKEKQLKDEEKYGIYDANDLDVLCHSCGTRNKVESKLRPLAVTCSKCDKRGVIY